MLTDASLPFLLNDVARQMRHGFGARARMMGVTGPQWRVLLSLARLGGPTQSELADRIEVERITVCRMIDRLAEAGLVERRADPADRRVWRIHLLPAAHAIVERLGDIGAEIEAEALSHLSDAERVALTAALLRMRDGLRERRKAA